MSDTNNSKSPDEQPRKHLCPDCQQPLKQIDWRVGKEQWVCAIALEAQKRGILGMPGKKHKAVIVYGRS